MLKIKNKFIIFIISLIIFIVGIFIFNSYGENKEKRFSYVELVESSATLNNNILLINQKEKLSVGDIVETTGINALAVIEWGDGSITRLGGNTSIKIEELYVSNDNTDINIGFKLLKGKSWSNVVSFLGENSYFKEYFRDTEAAVRGTVFNIDLDKDYLYVTDHQVTLTKVNGESIIVEEKQPLNLLNYSFINFSKFLIEVKDKKWENFNYTVDNEFLNGLKIQIEQNLDNLLKYQNIDLEEVLSSDNKKEIYNKLLSDYQKIHFIKPDNPELFKIKLELKNTLINLSEGEEKSSLVRNTLYDLKNTIKLKEYGNLDLLLPMFTENKEIIGDIDFKQYFKNDIIPEDLQNILKNNFSEFVNIFKIDFKNIDLNDLNLNINDIKEVNNKANSIIHNSLDKGAEKIGNLFNK